MLRAAHKIQITNTSILSQDSTLLSPVIDLNGLILHTKEKVPESIKHFLEKHEVKVNRIKTKEEIFVKVTGSYTLDPSAIEKFIHENTALCQLQIEQAKDIAPLPNLQNEILACIASESNRRYISWVDKYSTRDIVRPLITAGKTMNMTAGRTRNLGMIVAKENILFSGKYMINKGIDLELEENFPKTGVFAVMRSGQESNYSIDCFHLENGIVEAGTLLQIQPNKLTTGMALLSYDNDYKWIDHPFHGEKNFTHCRIDAGK